MLRSVKEGMLVMWDCGFHSFDMAVQTRQRKAHFLGRLPAHAKPKFVKALPDGSYYVSSSTALMTHIGLDTESFIA